MVDFQLQSYVLAYDFFVTSDVAQLKYVVKAVHIARHVEGYWAHVGDKILLYLRLCADYPPFFPFLVLVFICSKADHVAIFRQEKIKILKKSCNAPLHNQSLNIQMQIQLSK